jgi:hypothetical protein
LVDAALFEAIADKALDSFAEAPGGWPGLEGRLFGHRLTCGAGPLVEDVVSHSKLNGDLHVRGAHFEAKSELGEEFSHAIGTLIRGADELKDRFGHIRSYGKDAEASAVKEFEMRVVRRDFPPELLDAEAGIVDLRIVEENDRARAELREPGLEIVADGVIGVETVNMKEINCPGSKTGEG